MLFVAASNALFDFPMKTTKKAAGSCQLTMLVSLPATLTLGGDAFATEVQAKTEATGPHFVATSGLRHTPAHTPNLGPTVPAKTLYLVEVWDLRGSTPACSLGALCFSLFEHSAATCLARLDERLRALAQLEDEAEPTRHADAQLQSMRQLEAAA